MNSDSSSCECEDKETVYISEWPEQHDNGDDFIKKIKKSPILKKETKKKKRSLLDRLRNAGKKMESDYSDSVQELGIEVVFEDNEEEKEETYKDIKGHKFCMRNDKCLPKKYTGGKCELEVWEKLSEMGVEKCPDAEEKSHQKMLEIREILKKLDNLK